MWNDNNFFLLIWHSQLISKTGQHVIKRFETGSYTGRNRLGGAVVRKSNLASFWANKGIGRPAMAPAVSLGRLAERQVKLSFYKTLSWKWIKYKLISSYCAASFWYINLFSWTGHSWDTNPQISMLYNRFCQKNFFRYLWIFKLIPFLWLF